MNPIFCPGSWDTLYLHMQTVWNPMSAFPWIQLYFTPYLYDFFVGLAWWAGHIFTRKDFNAIFSNPPCRSASPLKFSPGGIFWVANNERHSSVLSLSFKSFLDFLFMFTGVCEDPMHSSSRYYAAQRGITSVHTMCICIHVSAFVFL